MLRVLVNSISCGLRFFSSKSTEEMAQELRDKIGRNSVEFYTVNKKFHIDLAGRAHYDKATQQYIPTPHVQAHVIHTSFFGKTRVDKKPSTTIAATKGDIRFARRLVGER